MQAYRLIKFLNNQNIIFKRIFKLLLGGKNNIENLKTCINFKTKLVNLTNTVFGGEKYFCIVLKNALKKILKDAAKFKQT